MNNAYKNTKQKNVNKTNTHVYITALLHLFVKYCTKINSLKTLISNKYFYFTCESLINSGSEMCKLLTQNKVNVHLDDFVRLKLFPMRVCTVRRPKPKWERNEESERRKTAKETVSMRYRGTDREGNILG